MTEIHRPTRLQSLLFFFFSLALAAFVLVWVFILNKGTLTVVGDAPFSFLVGGENIECDANECSVQLTPKQYSVTVSKEGYFPETQNIRIRRAKEIKINPALKFIPALRENSSIAVPEINIPLISPFLGVSRLENFPRNAKQTLFSASGKAALLALGKETYLYDVETRTVNKLDIGLNKLAAWAGEEIVFLDEENGKPVLKTWDNGKTQNIVVFGRAFKNPLLIGGSAAKKVLIAETAENSSGFVYYLIDIDKKTRRRLELNVNPVAAKMTDSYAIFESNKDNGEKEVLAINHDTLTRINIPSINLTNTIEISNNVFIFFSYDKKDSGKPAVGYSISEILEEAQRENFNSRRQMAFLYLTEFNVEMNAFKTILDAPVKENETVGRLTADPNGKKLYFVLNATQNGRTENKLFEVVLAP